MTMRTVRFRVRQGHLEPIEEFSLVEGTEVDVRLPVAPDASTAAALLALMQRLPVVDPSLVDEFDRAVEDGKLPVRSEGVFDGTPA